MSVLVKRGCLNARTDGDNLAEILSYLDLLPTSEEAQRITGLTEATISDVLRGQPIPDAAARGHIEVVTELVGLLAQGRAAGTGSADRGVSAKSWLRSGAVATSRGTRTPIEILTDSDLAAEMLRGLRR